MHEYQGHRLVSPVLVRRQRHLRPERPLGLGQVRHRLQQEPAVRPPRPDVRGLQIHRLAVVLAREVHLAELGVGVAEFGVGVRGAVVHQQDGPQFGDGLGRAPALSQDAREREAAFDLRRRQLRGPASVELDGRQAGRVAIDQVAGQLRAGPVRECRTELRIHGERAVELDDGAVSQHRVGFPEEREPAQVGLHRRRRALRHRVEGARAGRRDSWPE
jgi:hypothetical protein